MHAPAANGSVCGCGEFRGLFANAIKSSAIPSATNVSNGSGSSIAPIVVTYSSVYPDLTALDHDITRGFNIDFPRPIHRNVLTLDDNRPVLLHANARITG